ncbi:ras-domain-containing protein [Serendipita vermifera]|nr:ras-domain-containing protein [Serendipita vermifera]
MVEVNGKAITVLLWDLQGSGIYTSLLVLSTLIRRSHGFVLVFDTTSLESFNWIRNWIEEAEKHKITEFDLAPRILVGNKVDLTDQRAVEASMAQDFAAEHGMVYMETSAKTSINVEQLIFMLVKRIVEK